MIAGVVVAFATVPETPFAVVTDTDDTDPPPPPPDPLLAAVIRPFASIVTFALVYEPAVTAVFDKVAANVPVPEPVTSPVNVIV